MHHLKIVVLSLLALFPAAGRAAGSPEQPVSPTSQPIKAVVELFTSQGCSSCPPADALMKSFAMRDDLLAFSLPVDIWDHLGWKDTLAHPRNASRQRAYAESFGQGPVYTPQMVINGVTHAVGSNKIDIQRAIDEDNSKFARRRIPVSFLHHESVFMIDLGAAPEGMTPKVSTVWLGVVQRSVTVPIRRGENTGAEITYYNVLRDLVPVGAWDGKPKQLQLTSAAVMKSETERTFVLVQEGESGPIIGAAWLGS